MRRMLLCGSLWLAVSPAWSQATPHPHAQSHVHASPAPASVSRLMMPINGPAAPAIKTNVTVAGRVTLPNGRQAANAPLYLGWQSADGEMHFHKFLADSMGAFRLSVKLVPTPGNSAVGVTAFVPGSGFAWQSQDSASNALKKLDMKLKPLRTMQGRLIFSDGRPAARITMKSRELSPALNAEREPNAFQSGQNSVRVLPDELAALWKGQTDQTGRFTLRALPTGCAVALAPVGGVTLSDAGSVPFDISETGPASLGILVAVRLSPLHIQVFDVATGKPAVSQQVGLQRQNASDNLLASIGVQLSHEPGEIVTDRQGRATDPYLMPGSYLVTVRGQTRKVTVPEDPKGAWLQMRVRCGDFMGRILDANGKPRAKCCVAIRFPFDPNLRGSEFALTEELQRIQNADQSKLVTDANGVFRVPDFPWGAKVVTVHAVQGNALAEWTGAPTKIGDEFTLRMRPNALMTVTGRLIDPQRHVIKQTTCETLHWLPSPRRSWFATAQPVKVDDQGRFRVTGLERGESFSIITTQNMVRSQQALGVDIARAPDDGRILPGVHDFESPRFVTRSDTDEQDLGDTMVHPNDNPQENEQIYGGTNPDILARFEGFLKAPATDAVEEARTVLARYQTAIQTGEFDTAFRLSSNLSFGWAPNRSAFLQHGWLRPSSASTSSSPVRALPLVSRFTAAMLVAMSGGNEFGSAPDFDRAEKEAAKHPDWVFLARTNAKQVLLEGILRKEAGQWRVVTVPDLPGFNLASTVLMGGIQNPADFARIPASLDPKEQEAAVQFGRNFLQTWADKGAEALLAPHALAEGMPDQNKDQFMAALSARSDGGICPIERDEAVDLRPIAGLSAWDERVLLNGITARSRVAVAQAVDRHDTFMPIKQVMTETVMPFAYASATGKQYLMLLAKNDTGWCVIEPALPR